MQSVFKLPVAIEVLREIDEKKLALSRVVALAAADARHGPAGTMAVPATKTVRELLEAMIVNSDNVACDKLLSLVGGPRAVDARLPLAAGRHPRRRRARTARAVDESPCGSSAASITRLTHATSKASRRPAGSRSHQAGAKRTLPRASRSRKAPAADSMRGSVSGVAIS
jgi:hypothetical protein